MVRGRQMLVRKGYDGCCLGDHLGPLAHNVELDHPTLATTEGTRFLDRADEYSTRCSEYLRHWDRLSWNELESDDHRAR